MPSVRILTELKRSIPRAEKLLRGSLMRRISQLTVFSFVKLLAGLHLCLMFSWHLG